MPDDPSEIDRLLYQLWVALDLATSAATASNCVNRLDDIAGLCDQAAALAREAAALR